MAWDQRPSWTGFHRRFVEMTDLAFDGIIFLLTMYVPKALRTSWEALTLLKLDDVVQGLPFESNALIDLLSRIIPNSIFRTSSTGFVKIYPFLNLVKLIGIGPSGNTVA